MTEKDDEPYTGNCMDSNYVGYPDQRIPINAQKGKGWSYLERERHTRGTTLKSLRRTCIERLNTHNTTLHWVVRRNLACFALRPIPVKGWRKQTMTVNEQATGKEPKVEPFDGNTAIAVRRARMRENINHVEYPPYVAHTRRGHHGITIVHEEAPKAE